jgi:hypothetical protein
MQKNQVDALVESFFKPQAKKNDNQLSLDDLIAVINEVKSTIPSLALISEETRSTANTLQYSSIPDISVSELGWSSLEDKIEGGEKVSIPSEQRAQLDQYLRNIEGNTFEQKVVNISKFFQMTPEELEKSSLLEADNTSSKIQKLISYLVFYKTLTTIITNFNAASAGFAFESFLAVLLGGTQVPTASGTIADLYSGDNTPISLKLYAQASVEVGGSFTDLCNDMINPKKSDKPFIRYIVATKDLQGKGLKAEGKVSLYQFDIDLENIMNTMVVTSIHSRECIRLPKSFGQTVEQEPQAEQPVVPQQPQQPETPDTPETPTLSEAGKKKEKGDKLANEYYSPEESVEIYNALDEQTKKEALLQTYGYKKTKQFSMTKGNVFTVISGVKPSRKRGAQNPDPKIGDIVVGRSQIEATVNKISSLINASVFEIFSSLKSLTTNINGYFAMGMKDDNMATQAQIAAQNIDKKTAEIKQTK